MTPEQWQKAINSAGALSGATSAGVLAWINSSGKITSWIASHMSSLLSAEIVAWLAPLIGWGVPAAIFILSFLLAISAVRRRSVLMVPKAFNLDRTRQDQLYGREELITKLIDEIRDNELIFLTGESGVGKSALLRAGLMPTLRGDDRLFPVYVSNLGTDWDLDPPRKLFHAILSDLSEVERNTLGISRVINPASVTLNTAMSLLDAIPEKIGKTPIILFDQFDDYQLRFRDRFVTERGAWISVDQLRQINTFWEEIGSRFGPRVKALFVSRSDTASGLGSLQFISKVLSYPLGRLQADMLAPLLRDIAPQNVDPVVVKDPESGWDQLKSILQDELQQNGRVLPQEVRTVLLGLRRLRYLTPAAYDRGGRVPGVKALFIESAVFNASEATRLSFDLIFSILECLVVPDTSEGGEAKTEARTVQEILNHLNVPGLGFDVIENTLRSLETDELVRWRTELGRKQHQWQLDHDYLATAVLQANCRRRQWSQRLHRGALTWQRTSGNFAGFWRELLTVREQAAIFLERLRLVPMLVTLSVAGAVYITFAHNAKLTKDARPIAEEIGNGTNGADDKEAGALVLLAKSSEKVKNKVVDLLLDANGSTTRAARRPLPLVIAFAGLNGHRTNIFIGKLISAATSDGDLGRLAAISQLVQASGPSRRQEAQFEQIAMSSLSLKLGNVPAVSSTNSSSTIICQAVLAGIGGASATDILALYDKMRPLIDGEMGRYSANENTNNCLFSLLAKMASELRADLTGTVIVSLSRQAASGRTAFDSKIYFDTVVSLSKKLTQAKLQSLSEPAIRSFVQASRLEDAAVAARRLAPFVSFLSKDQFETVRDASLRWITKWKNADLGPIVPFLGAVFERADSATAVLFYSKVSSMWASIHDSRSAHSLDEISAVLIRRMRPSDRGPSADAFIVSVRTVTEFMLNDMPAEPSTYRSLLDRLTIKRILTQAAAAIIDKKSTPGQQAANAYLLDGFGGLPAEASVDDRRAVLTIASTKILEEDTNFGTSAWTAILIAGAATLDTAQAQQVASNIILQGVTRHYRFSMVRSDGILNAIASHLDEQFASRQMVSLLDSADPRLTFFNVHTEGIPIIARRISSEGSLSILKDHLGASGQVCESAAAALGKQLNNRDAAEMSEIIVHKFGDPKIADQSCWASAVEGMADNLNALQIADLKRTLAAAIIIARNKNSDVKSHYRALAHLSLVVPVSSDGAFAKHVFDDLFSAGTVAEYSDRLATIIAINSVAPKLIRPELLTKLLVHPWTYIGDSHLEGILGDEKGVFESRTTLPIVKNWVDKQHLDVSNVGFIPD